MQHLALLTDLSFKQYRSNSVFRASIMKWFTPDWQAGEINLDDGGEWREGGAADKAANLARWKSLCRQLPVFGRLAYPVRAEATKHVLPGCKSLSCPAVLC